MAPGENAARRPTGCARDPAVLWALETPGKPRSMRPPTTADAVNPDLPGMWLLRGPLPAISGHRALGAGDREVHVTSQCLVPELVGDLDFKPVLAFGKRRQRNRPSL